MPEIETPKPTRRIVTGESEAGRSYFVFDEPAPNTLMADYAPSFVQALWATGDGRRATQQLQETILQRQGRSSAFIRRTDRSFASSTSRPTPCMTLKS